MEYEPISEAYTFKGSTTKHGWFTIPVKIRDKFGDRWRVNWGEISEVKISSMDGNDKVILHPHIGANGQISFKDHLSDWEEIIVTLTYDLKQKQIEMTIQRGEQKPKEGNA